MIEAGNSDLIFSKRKAISALLPYAVTLDQGEQPALLDMFFRAAQSTKFEDFIWARPLANTLFSTPYPRSLDRVILLATPYAWRDKGPRSEDEVARWALAVSAVPYVEELGKFVVKALLQAAAGDSLWCCIPANVWAWLKKLQSPMYVPDYRWGITRFDVVHHIRGLGDIEILKSYLLIVWQNRISLDPSGFAEMKASIMEDFARVGMSPHRRDLIKELEGVRGCLYEVDRQLYKKLKELLLQVDMEAEKTLTSTLPNHNFFCLLTPCNFSRFPLDIHVRSASPLSIVSHPKSPHHCTRTPSISSPFSPLFILRFLAKCSLPLLNHRAYHNIHVSLNSRSMDWKYPPQHHFHTYSKVCKTTTLQAFDVILCVSNVRDPTRMACESDLGVRKQRVPVIEACNLIPSRAPQQSSLSPCFSSSNLLRAPHRV